MATPVVEQITAAIVTRLLTITESAGYEEAIAAVNRPNAPYADNEDPHPDYSVTVYQAECLPIHSLQREFGCDRQGTPKFSAWLQVYVLSCFLQTSGDAVSEIDPRLNQLCADVERCLNTERRSWIGSLARLHEERDAEWSMGFVRNEEGNSEDHAVRLLVFQVPYMTVYGDPYTLPSI